MSKKFIKFLVDNKYIEECEEEGLCMKCLITLV